MAKIKTKFFRVAVEGPTVDGRTIERAWIDQMVGNFNTATYTPRINLEHIPGFSPEPPFNAYGDVIELRSQDDELQIDGKPKKLRSLYARFEVNDQAVKVNSADQKVFTSVEIAPNYAGTGKAGLVGMAMTDTPASLGTERLAFSAKVSGNALSAAHETNLAFEAPEPPAPDSEVTTLAKSFTAFLKSFSKTPEEQTPTPTPAPTPAPAPANDNMSVLFTELGKFAGAVEKLSASVDGFGTRLTAIETGHAELKTKLGNTDAGGPRRTFSTGGGGTGPQADF
ncbi:hypothetical protein J2W22_003043 [Sphingomonas kyeonggiensis]|uniref:GPO family capsid scaffolding protein n=1 Tax=Sphingomonas kyeonggiensis TaxID=1268553 RepID=UPI002781079A|nr:GPO family capsid scaffolding protein [Sphingomonas kyeonggiensis]MDQ0250979.1 hypothetical protein [Sphingomonas kyeonggiensis]